MKLQKLKRVLLKVARSITLEPGLLIQSISFSLNVATISQMIIYKTCRVDFNQTESMCNDHLHDEQNKDLNNAVAAEVGRFNVYMTIVNSVIPCILSMYMGAWTDIFGRKAIMFYHLTMTNISGIIWIFNAVWIDSPKEYLFIPMFIYSLTGGYGAWMLATNSFVADISSQDDRAFRMGLVDIAFSLGGPIGAPIGAALFVEWGYASVFVAYNVLFLASSIVIYLCTRRFEWNPKRNHLEEGESRHLFSLHHVKDSVVAVFKERAGPNRKVLWLLIAVFILYDIPLFGEENFFYLYVTNRYKWQLVDVSRYTSVTSTVSIVGKMLVIPLLAKLQVSEPCILLYLLVSYLAQDVLQGGGADPWTYYAGGVIVSLFAFCL